jgi:two-component system chemotaxis response regulator CheB
MIRVLVVDDSAVVRQILSSHLCNMGDIEVVATAVDAFAARDKIVKLKPDVVTLDLEMPRMDGLTFLTRLMKYHPLPVIVVSSLSQTGSDIALRALELGAVDVVGKPGQGASVASVIDALADKIRAAAKTRQPLPLPADMPATPNAYDFELTEADTNILAIGASTGGTEAIKNVLLGLPANGPGTVIVQHLPARFTPGFAERLNDVCLMEVREARDGDEVRPGLALVAPGDYHMTLRRYGHRYFVETRMGPPVFHQRPSVDVLFHSVARQAGANAVGALLTGMGADGARGLLAMREAGGYTIAQDESTSAVFGMPREAIALNAADRVLPLPQIARQIVEVVSKRHYRQMTRVS